MGRKNFFKKLSGGKREGKGSFKMEDRKVEISTRTVENCIEKLSPQKGKKDRLA